MNLTTLTTLAGLCAAVLTAWALGGSTGSGALAGYLAGATVAGLAMIVQRRAARRRPGLVIHAVLGGFLLKACAMLALTLLVRFVEPFAGALDAVAFLLGFAGAALLVLAPATWETLRTLDPARSTPVGAAREARAP